jgi:hypothetical protein
VYYKQRLDPKAGLPMTSTAPPSGSSQGAFVLARWCITSMATGSTTIPITSGASRHSART